MATKTGGHTGEDFAGGGKESLTGRHIGLRTFWFK